MLEERLGHSINYVNKKAKYLSYKKFDQNIRTSSLEKNTKMVLSWSGGKDSCLLLNKAIERDFRVVSLFNLVDDEAGISISPPYNKELTVLQSEALGIKLRHVNVSGNPRKAFRIFLKSLKEDGIDVIGMSYTDTGGQRDFVQRIASKEGLSVFEPLCSTAQRELLEESLNTGTKAVIVSTDYKRMNEVWLGRMIDRRFLSYLTGQKSIDCCGEKGEFHTFVVDSPLFRKRISIEDYIRIRVDDYYHMYINKARLIEKGLI